MKGFLVRLRRGPAGSRGGRGEQKPLQGEPTGAESGPGPAGTALPITYEVGRPEGGKKSGISHTFLRPWSYNDNRKERIPFPEEVETFRQ